MKEDEEEIKEVVEVDEEKMSPKEYVDHILDRRKKHLKVNK